MMDELLWGFYGLVALLQALDVWTTVRALAGGAREANPVVAWVMERVGVVPALIGLKAALLLLIAAAVIAAPSRWLVAALAGIALFYCWVVLHNARIGR